MRPTVDQLHTSGRYTLIESFTIDEMSQFILREVGLAPRANQQAPKRGPQRWLFLIGLALLGESLGTWAALP